MKNYGASTKKRGRKAIYTGLKLVGGKLHVIADYNDNSMPTQLRNLHNYSKTWGWGESAQAKRESYDLAYAILHHTYRGFPMRHEIANRYAIPFAHDVLCHLPTGFADEWKHDGATSVVLWTLHQDDVSSWVLRFEEALRRGESFTEAHLPKEVASVN